jgi:hypothetical protein
MLLLFNPGPLLRSASPQAIAPVAPSAQKSKWHQAVALAAKKL